MQNANEQFEIFFVDDDPGIRKLICQDLEQLGFDVRCFDNGQDCLDQLQKKSPHLLITDVKMPGMDGLSLMSKAKTVAPWVLVMVITGFGYVPMAVKAIKMGAVDFIEKPLDRQTFLYKVKCIAEEDRFANVPAGNSLTKTERKVLKLILDGKANKEIAHVLDRAMRTVEFHRSSIMRKFAADNIVDLVKKASNLDLTDVD